MSDKAMSGAFVHTPSSVEDLCSTYTVSRECGISIRQLYYWELIGMVRPHYENFGTRRFRRYCREDLQRLKNVKALLDQGFTLQAVREQLKNPKDEGREARGSFETGGLG